MLIRRATVEECAALRGEELGLRARAFARRPGANRRGLRGFGGGARETTPVTILGAKTLLWLRGDRGVTLDGSSNVSTWADQSGNGRNATQAVAGARPSVVTLDGNDAIDFTASTDQLVIASGTDLNIHAGHFMWVVCKQAAAGTNNGVMGKWGTGGNAWALGHVTASGSTQFVVRNAADSANQTATSATVLGNNALHLIEARRDESGTPAGIRLDANAEGTAALTTVNEASTAQTAVGGYVPGTLTTVPNVVVGEIIIADNPSAAEITAIRAYLDAYWPSLTVP